MNWYKRITKEGCLEIFLLDMGQRLYVSEYSFVEKDFSNIEKIFDKWYLGNNEIYPIKKSVRSINFFGTDYDLKMCIGIMEELNDFDVIKTHLEWFVIDQNQIYIKKPNKLLNEGMLGMEFIFGTSLEEKRVNIKSELLKKTKELQNEKLSRIDFKDLIKCKSTDYVVHDDDLKKEEEDRKEYIRLKAKFDGS